MQQAASLHPLAVVRGAALGAPGTIPTEDLRFERLDEGNKGGTSD